MKARNTWFLVMLAAGLFAFIYFFERHLHPGAAQLGPQRIFPSLKPDAVTSVQISPAGKLEIVASQTNGTWQLIRPISALAEGEYVDNLLKAFAAVHWHTRLTAQDLKNRMDSDREFGFEAPQFSLQLEQPGIRFQVKVGALTPFGDEVYLQVVGRDEIYVVTADLLKFIPHTADNWRDPQVAHLQNLVFDTIAVTNNGKAFELQRVGTNQVWRLTRPAEARADSTRITDLLRRLEDLRFVRFVPDTPPADPEALGLQPPAFELALAQGTNTVLALQFGRSPTNDPTVVYARKDGETGIGLVPVDQLAPWRAGYEDFRDRHLVNLAAGPITEVDVHGTEDFVVRQESNDVWRVVAPENLPADNYLVRAFLGALGNIQVTQFVKSVVTEPDLPGYGLAPAARQYTLKSGGSNVLAQLNFSAPQTNSIYARRSDENAVYAVATNALDRLPVAGWQLRDRHIWTFAGTNVARMLIRQNGQSRELLRTPSGKWAFAAGSQGILDNLALDEVADMLGDLTADAWVARGQENRAKYGFTDSTMHIDVDVHRGDKLETLTLELGGATPTDGNYAAVQLDGQTWYFECPPQLREMIRSFLFLPPAKP